MAARMTNQVMRVRFPRIVPSMPRGVVEMRAEADCQLLVCLVYASVFLQNGFAYESSGPMIANLYCPHRYFVTPGLFKFILGRAKRTGSRPIRPTAWWRR